MNLFSCFDYNKKLICTKFFTWLIFTFIAFNSQTTYSLELELSWEPAVDSQSGIKHYIIYRDGKEIAQSLSHSYTDSGLIEGIEYRYEISAVNGVDSESGLSPALIFTSISNSPPIVEAGADQNILLSEQANLSAIVNDDGLPNPPAKTTSKWNKISGPGDITFENDSAENTTASFSQPGTYEIQLAVSDGELEIKDTLSVFVTKDNEQPIVEAGADQNILLSKQANLSAIVNDDGLPNPPAKTTSKWNKISGPGDITFENDSAKKTAASFSQPGTYEIQLAVSDGELETKDTLSVIVTKDNEQPIVDAGVDQNILLSEQATLSATVNDDGLPNPPAKTTSKWNKISGPGDIIFVDDSAENTTASFSKLGTYEIQLAVSDGELETKDTLSVIVTKDNEQPIVDAGVDQNILLSEQATLSATVNDDGLPNPPAKTSSKWNKISGPGDITFENDSAENTTASFSQPGTYEIQLAVSDGDLETKDTLSVFVTKDNEQPIVDAGVDQNILLSEQANLSAIVNDDGLPNPPAKTTSKWNKISGPGDITFVDDSAENTTASFSQPGTYEIQLAVSDGDLETKDTLSVIVTKDIPETQPVISIPSNGFAAKLSNYETFTIAGKAEKSSSVEIFANAISLGLLQADENGSWLGEFSFQPVDEGRVSLTARATSLTSNPVEGIYDLSPPTNPGIPIVQSN